MPSRHDINTFEDIFIKLICRPLRIIKIYPKLPSQLLNKCLDKLFVSSGSIHFLVFISLLTETPIAHPGMPSSSCFSFSSFLFEHRQKINTQITSSFLWMRCAQNFIKAYLLLSRKRRLVAKEHVESSAATIRNVFVLAFRQIKLAFTLSRL